MQPLTVGLGTQEPLQHYSRCNASWDAGPPTSSGRHPGCSAASATRSAAGPSSAAWAGEHDSACMRHTNWRGVGGAVSWHATAMHPCRDLHPSNHSIKQSSRCVCSKKTPDLCAKRCTSIQKDPFNVSRSRTHRQTKQRRAVRAVCHRHHPPQRPALLISYQPARPAVCSAAIAATSAHLASACAASAWAGTTAALCTRSGAGGPARMFCTMSAVSWRLCDGTFCWGVYFGIRLQEEGAKELPGEQASTQPPTDNTPKLTQCPHPGTMQTAATAACGAPAAPSVRAADASALATSRIAAAGPHAAPTRRPTRATVSLASS